jgi:ABC-type transport system involved in multi-copper enzyme maturation permease subunit
MFKIIFIKELQNHIYSLKFQVSFLIILLVFITGSIGFVKTFDTAQKKYFDYSNNRTENLKRLSSENATLLAINRQAFDFSPRKNGIISDCNEKVLPNKIIYSAYNVFGFEVAKGSSNPLLKVTQGLSWSFIVTTVLSFLALLFAFDTVSGEKEQKTLALSFSNGISRGTILLGKFLSIISILLITEITGIVISILLIIIAGNVPVDSRFLFETAGFIVLSGLFLSCFTAFGMLASVASRNSNASLMISLSIWLLFVIIIPNTAVFWANKLFPIEHADVVEKRRAEGWEELSRNAPPGSWSSHGGNPFYPRHELRANLQMSFLVNDKKHKDAYFADMMRQFENTRYFTLLSPVALFDYSNEAFLGGGYLRFRKNWDDLHIFQEQFLQFFKDFDGKDEGSPHWYNPFEMYSTTRLPVAIETVLVYEEKLSSYGQRLDFMKYYLMIMIIYSGIIFFISFTLFVKYDVR